MTTTLRFRYAKLGKVRFTSHRDVARMWERALRRSGLPVAWSKGFSPRPLLSFGYALPTGCESVAEYLDVHLAEEEGTPDRPDGEQSETSADEQRPWSPAGCVAALPGRLSPLLPQGVDVLAVGKLGDGVDSLQQAVTSCSWELEVLGVPAEELATRVEDLLDARSAVLRRERNGLQADGDLRPSVRALTVLGAVDDVPGQKVARCRLHAELATQPRGLRVAELVQRLGADLTLVRACRTQQWIERDGIRCDPLAMTGRAEDSFHAPHAEGRAS